MLIFTPIHELTVSDLAPVYEQQTVWYTALHLNFAGRVTRIPPAPNPVSPC